LFQPSTWYPEVYLRVTNSGVSGNTSRDLLQRFDSDVVALNPDWVSICIGINDVWNTGIGHTQIHFRIPGAQHIFDDTHIALTYIIKQTFPHGLCASHICYRILLQRFDSDVVALNPDWVSICIGINDVWRQFDSPAIPDGQVMPQNKDALYRSFY